MKNILVLHGWQANSKVSWFPLVKEEYEKKGYKVFVPDLPGGYFPDKDGWLKAIEDFHPDKDWILIGHSLGGVAILNYLQNATEPVGQVILVATPYSPMDFKALEEFFEAKFDWEKIKANASKIDLIYEDEDEVVPLQHGQWYAQQLSCPIHVINGCYHLIKMDLNILEKLIDGKS